MSHRCQVPESTGKGLKNHFYEVLFNKKMQNFEFFKTPSFKIDETLMVLYTHANLCKTTFKSLPEFCAYIREFSAYVSYFRFSFYMCKRTMQF